MRSVLLSLLACSFLVACSTDDATSPESPSVKLPQAGSTFSYSGYQLDLQGAKVDGTDYSFVETVLATGLTHSGKSAVWSVESTSPNQEDTTYYCLDSGKDLLVEIDDIAGEEGAKRWIRLPVTSGTTFTDSAVTTQEVSGFPLQLETVISAVKSGEESLSVGTESVTTMRIRVTVRIKASLLGQVVQEALLTQQMWFAPSIGAVIRRSAPTQQVGNETTTGFWEGLTSYTLK